MKFRNPFVKFFVVVVIIIALVYGLIAIGAKKLYDKVDGSIKDQKELIGESILFKGDTLMITDYTTLTQNYTMENGMEMNKILVKKLIIKE
jgi:hypothetical protein